MHSIPTPDEVAEIPTSSPSHGTRRSHRRRWAAVAIALVIVAAVVALGVGHPFGVAKSLSSAVTNNSYPTSLATVARQSLSSQTQVDATLGYAGSYAVVNQAQGTITSLPNPGQVISQGQVLYEVNSSPVVLLYGATPAYRNLAEDISGPDVQELNADLVTMGYVTGGELSPTSDEFGYWTKVGVEKLQAALGEPQNGRLSLGQVEFLPTAARISALPSTTILGTQAPPGSTILSATSTSRVVSIALDAAQQSEVAVGDQVTITLPNYQTTPGTVASIGSVATTASGATTVPVTVTPNDPAATGSDDQAPVGVTITTATVKNVLVVPVDSLLALAGGGYAVEVVSAKHVHSLVSVKLGLFDDADGMVQVTGSKLASGQRIVVPAL